jgi:hypothetical protein
MYVNVGVGARASVSDCKGGVHVLVRMKPPSSKGYKEVGKN